MDWKLHAPKLFIAQVCNSSVRIRKGLPTVRALGGLLFQRAWLQGVVLPGLSNVDDLYLDDGSGVIQLILLPKFRRPDVGAYMLVLGLVHARPGHPIVIKVHKLVDLSASPSREAMWSLEVIDSHHRFYDRQLPQTLG